MSQESFILYSVIIILFVYHACLNLKNKQSLIPQIVKRTIICMWQYQLFIYLVKVWTQEQNCWLCSKFCQFSQILKCLHYCWIYLNFANLLARFISWRDGLPTSWSVCKVAGYQANILNSEKLLLLHPAEFHNINSCQSKMLWKYSFVSSNYLLNHLLNSIISSTSFPVFMPKCE